jgi:hypothetical protein
VISNQKADESPRPLFTGGINVFGFHLLYNESEHTWFDEKGLNQILAREAQ